MKLLVALAVLPPARSMKLLASWLLLLAATPLGAGTVEASHAATALLGPGDSLVFGIPSWNYTAQAARFGSPMNPTGVSFMLISAPSDVPALFEAELQTADGSFSLTFGTPLSFSPGYLSSSSYSGTVSTLGASFHLSAQESQRIFDGSGAELALRNLGPAVLLGLPPNTFQQDLFVSLSGGPLSVGALHGAVLQETAAAAPEPHSGAFLLAGGVLLCLCARAVRPVRATSNQPFANGL